MDDTTKRDALKKHTAVMEEFRMTWTQQSAPGVACIMAGHDGFAMVAEITRLRAILAALREPSEAVIGTVVGQSSLPGIQLIVVGMIRAAVEAAEQEISRKEAATLEVLSTPAKTEFPPRELIDECGW